MGSTSVKVSLETDVLIIGGGPVGMFTALRLSELGQKCVLVERNTHTTIHPKMEYTSHRTMEIYRRTGLIKHLKPVGVGEHHKFGEIFTTGLGEGNFLVGRFDRPSPKSLRKTWAESNDGSHPLEPHMRQSQVVYESVLKRIVQREPLIQDNWGYSFEFLTENDDSVLSTIIDPSGKSIVVESRYVIGCDGAGSKVRQSAGLRSPRRSLPLNLVYVHFRSKELEKMQSQGDFWHMMILTGAIVVAQDEVDVYTLHRMVPPGVDMEIGKPEEFINESLGGMRKPFNLKVDQVIVSGKWRSDLSIADSFRSKKGRVFLAGDAAHQLTPAGGHGLNSGIQDAFDLTWKLNALLRGWGGEGLLDSYSKERRPVAELNTSMVEKSTIEVILPWMTKATQIGPEKLLAANSEGQSSRDEVKDAIMPGYWLHDQTGTVMGYRYNDSPIVIPDSTASEPPVSVTEYTPSTWPGARAPHVFLSDGTTPIFDLYGPDFTLVDFSPDGRASQEFVVVASTLRIPITRLHLPEEAHCREVWERDVVLVRPDGFVSWRCAPEGAESLDSAVIREVLLIAAGKSG